eukprot:6018631-Lingulodinium_polyedra.AAC.1
MRAVASSTPGSVNEPLRGAAGLAEVGPLIGSSVSERVARPAQRYAWSSFWKTSARRFRAERMALELD